jgi:hypothetical protein
MSKGRDVCFGPGRMQDGSMGVWGLVTGFWSFCGGWIVCFGFGWPKDSGEDIWSSGEVDSSGEEESAWMDCARVL